MTIQTSLGVVGTLVSYLQLVDSVVINVDDWIRLGLLTLFALHLDCLFSNGGCQTAIGQTHKDAVEPYLISVDGLVPEYLVGNSARLVLQLFHHGLHGQQVLGFRPFLIHTRHKMTCTDVVEVVVKDVVAGNVTLLVNHLVGVHLTVFADVLTAIAQIGVKHAFQFNAHDIAPLGFLGKVEHVALWNTLHLRVCQPLGIVLVGRILQDE